MIIVEIPQGLRKNFVRICFLSCNLDSAAVAIAIIINKHVHFTPVIDWSGRSADKPPHELKIQTIQSIVETLVKWFMVAFLLLVLTIQTAVVMWFLTPDRER